MAGRSRRTVVALAAATAAASACTGSPTVERGFGSRQLVSLRDSTATFNGSTRRHSPTTSSRASASSCFRIILPTVGLPTVGVHAQF